MSQPFLSANALEKLEKCNFSSRIPGEGPPRKRRRGGNADGFYGPNAAEGPKSQEELLAANPDMPEDDLVAAKAEKLRELALRVATPELVRDIVAKTTKQSRSSVWRKIRTTIIPGSLMAKVVKRKDSTPCHKLVEEIVTGGRDISRLKGVQFGTRNERTAIDKFILDHGITDRFEPTGLHISPRWPYLGASPDGLLGGDGVIEVKCIHPHTLKGLSLEAAAAIKTKKERPANFCLVERNGVVQLDRAHDYYCQIQGQLAMTGRKYCMFLVYTAVEVEDPQGRLSHFVQKFESEMSHPLIWILLMRN